MSVGTQFGTAFMGDMADEFADPFPDDLGGDIVPTDFGDLAIAGTGAGADDNDSGPPRALGPVALYVLGQRVESAALVARGERPALRTCAPGALGDGTGTVIYVENGKLRSRTLNAPGGAPFTAELATAEEIARLFGGPEGTGSNATPVYLRDATALGVMSAVLRRSHDQGHTRIGDVAFYAANLPVTGRVTVLTWALARKFWAPAGMSTERYDTWRAAFGLGNAPAAMTDEILIQAVCDRAGITTTQQGWIQQARTQEGSLVSHLLRAGTGASIAAFKTVQAYCEAWAAIERVDPLLRHLYLLSGEVVVVTPFKLIGGLIHARVSTPFKLRVGEVLLFDDIGGEANDSGAVLLTDLGYDDGLVGEFNTAKSAKREAASRGRYLLDEAQETGGSVYATAAPFVGTGFIKGFAGQWASRARTGDPISRDMPLYVSLAGAPVSAA